MTVETAVKIEGDKCGGVEMRSTCEDPSPKSVGGGCECNGGGGGDSKDDYVFVNDCDVTSDDHGEVEGNDGDVSEAIADLQGSIKDGDGDGDGLDSCNGCSSKVDENVKMIKCGGSNLENVIVVEEESDLVKENREIKVKKDGVIENTEVVIENSDRNNDEGEVDVGDRDLEVVEESDAKSKADDEMVVDTRDECNGSVDGVGCHSLDNAENYGGGSDELPSGSVEIEEELQLEKNEVCTKEPEKLVVEVEEPEVIEQYVNSHIDEVLVIESMDDIVEESKPIEAHVVHQSQEDGHHIDLQSSDGETKAPDSNGAEVVLPDNVVTEKQSAKCELQDLQPAENGELCPVETVVEVQEQGDLDPPQDLKSLDSEATTCDLEKSVENQDASESTPQSEGCREPQGVSEQSENLSNLALTASELDGSAQESTVQCEETTSESTPANSTVTVQSDILDNPVDGNELDTVHGGRVEVITQVERSLEFPVQEASSIDQAVEDTVLVDKEVSVEDVSLNEAETVEETDNSTMLKSVDEAIAAEKSKDIENRVSGNEVTILESPRDAGSCLTSEGGDLTGLSDIQVAPPVSHDTDVINEQGVENDGSNVDESSFDANLENSNDVLPSSVVGTEIEVKPENGHANDLTKESCDSEGTLRFGSFVCQTKSNGVSSTFGDVNAQIITDGVQTSPLEGSSIAASLSDVNPVRSPFRWLIKVPRLDDVEFEQIKKFQMELEKKTQDRDSFRKVLMEKMAVFQEVKDKFHTAKAEERNAHQLMMAKKREIESAQSLLKLARDGNTVERIDGQILDMERRIQHETMDLAEEKKLIREIKLLNNQRERLAADTQGQQEVYQAVGRRVETEEQLKVLRKEMDALRENHSKAYERFKAAERKYEEESTLKRKLEAEKDSLARIRQEAYEHFQTLKKQAYEKNKPCYNYRDAKKDVLNLKAGEEESLERICVNQVENFMELWNKDDKFRKEYIRCNKRSTLRRFNTLDGRELGIDEKKPLLEDFSNNGVTSAKVNTVSTALTSEREFPLIVKKPKEDDSSEKVTDKKNTNVLAKKRGETTTSNGLAEPSGRIETEEKEGSKLTKEEEELARKAEQKRREEEEELLKEKRRLEEKAKAQEALERKKRMAEKAQARAKFKAEKEAEEKRKEKEKRAKKKGKKKGLETEPTEVEPAEVPESSSETTGEVEITEKPSTVAKKTHKPTVLYTKQVKTTKSIPAPPAPLRNRGKRRIPQWAWWLVLAILTALLIFPLGSIDIVGLLKPFLTSSYK